MSIVTYTQYRYIVAATVPEIKAIYENDAIQRALANVGGVSVPEDLFTKADNYGATPLNNFASKSFTYYTSNVSTSNIKRGHGDTALTSPLQKITN
jgi:hypothetical protein